MSSPLITFLDIVSPKYLTSHSTLIEAIEESELEWIESSSHFLMLRDEPDALEKIEIALSFIYH